MEDRMLQTFGSAQNRQVKQKRPFYLFSLLMKNREDKYSNPLTEMKSGRDQKLAG